MTLTNGQQIGPYTVVAAAGQSSVPGVYRVRDTQGRLRLLRIGDLDETSRTAALLRELTHPGVPVLADSGTGTLPDGSTAGYVVTEFFSSEPLASHLKREAIPPANLAQAIALNVLRALRYLHTRPTPLAHGHVDAQHVWLDLTGEPGDLRLVGFSHACRPAGESDLRGDLRGVGELLYMMTYGAPADATAGRQRATGVHVAGIDKRIALIIDKALSRDPEWQFASADEMVKAIVGTADIAPPPNSRQHDGRGVRHTGKGFADVAGMDDLKRQLREEVLYVLRDRERAERYRLTIPNGMLLYGPPGCGKTFIAERFAEEAGYYFRLVKGSDLASVYIHGTQEKIAELFDLARAQAPAVICFDEFDALVPKRNDTGNVHLNSEVNEFLAQLNNCGLDRVFVIATSNQPELIDEAVLRRGRIDHLVYVPLPDAATRQAMIELHLQGRPCEAGIDTAHLARLTNHFVASEIAFAIGQAARQASVSDSLITQSLLESVLRGITPRTSPDTIKHFERVRQRLEQVPDSPRPRVGF